MIRKATTAVAVLSILAVAIGLVASGASAATVSDDTDVSLNDSGEITVNVSFDDSATSDESADVELLNESGSTVESATLDASSGGSADTTFANLSAADYTVTVSESSSDIVSEYTADTSSGGSGGSIALGDDLGSTGVPMWAVIVVLIAAAAYAYRDEL